MNKNELRAIAVLNKRWVKVKPGKDSFKVGFISLIQYLVFSLKGKESRVDDFVVK